MVRECYGEVTKWSGRVPKWSGRVPKWSSRVPKWSCRIPKWSCRVPKWSCRVVLKSRSLLKFELYNGMIIMVDNVPGPYTPLPNDDSYDDEDAR